MAVRREKVILELEDHFSTKMAKAAAATKLLDRELSGLDGSTVRSSRNADALGDSVERTTKRTKEYTLETALAEERTSRFRKELREQAKAAVDAERGIDRLSTSAVRGGRSIDQFSGRLALLTKTAAVLGPTLAPIGAVGIAGVAGLASQFGFAATGAISLVAAAQGVGDALKAVNDAALEPTAANLEKAREAMSKLGPEAQAFVTRFQEIRPILGDIRDAAAAGWFPGLTESLTSLEQVAPEVASLFEKIGTVGGNLVAEGAAAFAGPGWSDFRSFVAAEAPQALDDLGRTLGNVAKGLAELWMAFGPLNSSFSSWMLDASRSFADWAAGLSETQGFQEFVEYVRTNGPKVADAAVAIANAVLQIAEAAAPLGGPVLEALTSIANAIAIIADSPLGTPIMAGVTAMSALSLATNVATAALGRFTVASAAAGAAGAGAAGKGKFLAASVPVGLAAAGSTLIPDTEDTRRPGPAFNDPFVGPLKALLKQDADQWAGSSMVKNLFGGGDRLISDEMIAGVTSMSSALDGLADSTENANEALTDQARVTLGAFSAETQYREALKAAQAQAATNNAGIKGNSEAALANRRALEGLAGAWQQQREEMAAAGKSTEQIERRQREARRAFIETATAMGVPIEQARRLSRELLGIPKKVKVDVTVQTGESQTQVNRLKAAIDAIRDKTVTIRTITQAANLTRRQDAADARPGGSANGSTVPKDGGPYSDRFPYLLAPGEEVISNRHGQADRHRPLLKAINAGMLGDGGTSGLDGWGFLAGGGTAGKRGKRSKNLGSFLGWDIVNQVPRSLNDFINGLEASRDALQSEISAREDVAKQLGDSVTSKLTSALFPGSDVWGAGGSWQDVIGILTGGTATANMWSSNANRLRGLGLDDPGALNALLTQASPEDLANLAATATQEQIAQYEQAFQANAAAVAGAGAQAQAAQYAAMAAELAASRAELVRLNAQFAAFSKNGPTATGAAAGKAAADAGNKGAGRGARNRNRSALTP